MSRASQASLLCVLAVVAAPQLGAAEATSGVGSLSTQKSLDMLASFPIPPKPAGPGAPYLPVGEFKTWSAQDQSTVPVGVIKACEMIWVMFHDNPAFHLLPQAQPHVDELALGGDVCVAGHMPSDWPLRPKLIQNIRDILSRAKALGSPLIMPAALMK